MAAARRRNREDLMRWTLLLAALLASAAVAQPYPSRLVKVVVPFPPGATPDIVARTLAARLQDALGQPFVVENRTGAGGNIGTEVVAKAPADGYTLLVSINGPVATNKYLYRSLPYDPDRDLAPISLLAAAPQMLVVVPELKLEGLRAFIDYARSHPGRISYGSVGSGSASHLTMELLKSEARIEAVHVPYRGFPPAVTDMLAGNIQAMFAIIPGVLPHVKAGKMKGLAVTALKRSPLAPDVPSVAELGLPQLESLAWIGLLAPAGTPPEVLTRLSGETMRSMRAADVRELLGRQGFDVVGGTPADFEGWIRAESRKWAAVIKASGATAD
jgi:tripartite-type tricarboxylate transporter receptor subunit TctC